MKSTITNLLSFETDLLGSLSSRRDELSLRSLSLSRLRAVESLSLEAAILPDERSLRSSFRLIRSRTGDGESVGSLFRLEGLGRFGDLSLDLPMETNNLPSEAEVFQMCLKAQASLASIYSKQRSSYVV